MKERNKAIPAAYLFLVKKDQILIARRFNTGYEDGNYQVPAGHVEAGELPREALLREAKEEIGIEILPENTELVHVSYRPKHDNTDNRVDFFFKVELWSGEVTNLEPKKCDDLKWVNLSDLPTSMTYHIRDAIQCMMSGTFYKEIGLDILKQNGLYKI